MAMEYNVKPLQKCGFLKKLFIMNNFLKDPHFNTI